MRNLRYDLFLSFVAGVIGMAAIAFLLWHRMVNRDG